MRAHQSIKSGPTSKSGRWKVSRGQILIMFAAGIVALLGMVALAVDAGFLMAERRQVQNSADAGALAAAKVKLDYLYDPNSESLQIESGKQYAAQNADTSQDNVDVDPDPVMNGFDDVYIDDTINRYVEVSVSKDVTSFFLRALYTGEWRVSASAVAGVIPIQRPYALLALGCGPGGSAGIYVNGSGNIDVNEGSIMSNCRIDRSGHSSVVKAEGTIDAHGPIDAGTLWSAGEGFNPNRVPVPDPVVQMGIEPPDKSEAQQVRIVDDRDSLEDAVTNLTNLSANSGRCPSGATCFMQPGYYGGNMTLDVRGTLLMLPGVYYFGDSFRLEGQTDNALIQGSDVMLYFDDNARFDPGNGHIKLSAPDESPYTGGLDGMLLWIANCTPFLMQAGGTFEMEGVLYAPCSHVRLYGSPGTKGVQVVVGSLELAGGGSFDILFTEYIDADMPQVFLVE
jgi:hypothetical protein